MSFSTAFSTAYDVTGPPGASAPHGGRDVIIVEGPPAARVVVADPQTPHIILVDDDGTIVPIIVTEAMTTTVVVPLEPASSVIQVVPDPTQVVIAAEPPGVQVRYADPELDHVIQPVTLQHVVISSPDETGQMLVAVSNRGPKGDPGDATTTQQGQQWIQEMPASIWEITSELQYQAAGIIVFGDDGYQYDGFLVQYDGWNIRLIFDIPLAGVAWLS